MKTFHWDRFKKLRWLLATDRPEPTQQAERIVAMQRDVVLPSKAGVCLVVLGYLFFSGWFEEPPSTHSVVMETLKHYFEVYLICTLLGTIFFISWRRLPPELFQWLAFTLGLLDGLFMAGIIILTGGFDSIAFWVFPALIVLNALSIPLAMPQFVLNLLLSVFYMVAVVSTPPLNPNETLLAAVPGRSSTGFHGTNQTLRLTGGSPAKTNRITLPKNPESDNPGDEMLSVFYMVAVASTPPLNPNETLLAVVPGRNSTGFHGTNQTLRPTGGSPAKTNRITLPKNPESDNPGDEIVTEQLLLRVSVLWLLTLCCYGAQVLSERQRLAILEAGEFAAREGQLHSAGRLAAEFAHQIKNPLAVINNAAFSLERSLRGNEKSAALQIEIIREEVARADKVITQIMGYAQLSEGRVEKLKVVPEIESAIAQVFPEAVPTGIKLTKHFTGPLPPLLMQRGHLAEILVNLLLNAREALGARGNVVITASSNRELAVEITVADDGTGIAPDKIERVFEAYFTTKEKGTGLGLAIVKHNVELYGGTVRVDSVLGKGAKFTVIFPAKSLPKPFAK